MKQGNFSDRNIVAQLKQDIANLLDKLSPEQKGYELRTMQHSLNLAPLDSEQMTLEMLKARLKVIVRNRK